MPAINVSFRAKLAVCRLAQISYVNTNKKGRIRNIQKTYLYLPDIVAPNGGVVRRDVHRRELIYLSTF
jgi:hypothetical protein